MARGRVSRILKPKLDFSPILLFGGLLSAPFSAGVLTQESLFHILLGPLLSYGLADFRIYNKKADLVSAFHLVAGTGFEPVTFGL